MVNHDIQSDSTDVGSICVRESYLPAPTFNPIVKLTFQNYKTIFSQVSATAIDTESTKETRKDSIESMFRFFTILSFKH